MSFSAYDIIGKTKNKISLTSEEINWFVEGCYKNQIPTYQISAWLMAVVLNGLSDAETYHLTLAMANSGKVYDFPRIGEKLKVDKHSTGGVGDSVSIILLPLLVSAGLSTTKLSGRGLGFTGGTIDKLDSVGINTDLTFIEACDIYKKTGLVLLQQTADVAPADGVFYSLRDVTNTVWSIPLIASSIMSKKLAIKNDFLFLDVKYGDGALCQTLDFAKQLSTAMLNIANQSTLKTFIHITSMQQPLSSAIGNAIEVVEAVKFLSGHACNSRLYELIVEIGASVLHKTKISPTLEESREKIISLIKNKEGLQVLKTWFSAQGVDWSIVEQEKYFNPKHKVEIFSDESGYVSFKSIVCFGEVSNRLGAGRIVKEDVIDPHAGIYVHVSINDEVKKGDLLYTLYSSKEISSFEVKKLKENTLIGNKKIDIDPLIIHVN